MPERKQKRRKTVCPKEVEKEMTKVRAKKVEEMVMGQRLELVGLAGSQAIFRERGERRGKGGWASTGKCCKRKGKTALGEG